MSCIVFLLEEKSAKRCIEGLVERVFSKTHPHVEFFYMVFEGKHDLERNIELKLRAWLKPNSAFVILRDQDSGDCRSIKRNLVALAAKAKRDNVTVRVACKELEAWYLGDLEALDVAYGATKFSRHGGKAKYRNPDLVDSPSKELSRLVEDFRKTDCAERMGKILKPETNKSASFRTFFQTLVTIERRISETVSH